MIKISKKPNFPMAVVMGLFCLFCMYMIFMFSYQSAAISADKSMSLYSIFVKLCGGREIISHNAFRKLAHFSEFTAFSFSFFSMLYFARGKLYFFSSFVFCILYSMSDEVHQFFVPERACRVFDVFVDGMGIVFGITVFWALVFIFSKLFRKNVA